MPKHPQSGTGYVPGNNSDKIKHSNLVCMARALARTLSCYVELHSGLGILEGYVGSSIKVIEELRKNNNHCPVILNELESNNRKRLLIALQTRKYQNFVVYSDWKESLDKHILPVLNKDSLVLIDPTEMKAYTEPNGILNNLEKILRLEPSIFLFVPERVTEEAEEHRQILSDLGAAISSCGAVYADLVYTVKRGCFSRRDHNIIVSSNSDVLKKIEENHESFSRALKSGK